MSDEIGIGSQTDRTVIAIGGAGVSGGAPAIALAALGAEHIGIRS